MDLINRMMGGLTDTPEPVTSGFWRMGQGDKIQRLQTVPILAECTGRQLREVARIAEVVELPAGAVLARTGDPGEDFFFIVDGSAEVAVPDGKRVHLAPGEFFGEMSLLDDGPRTATVVAGTAIRLLVIKRRHFATLLREVPALALKICSTLARRLREAEQRLKQLSNN
jgi:CRP-like cAMP-binding protein